MKTEQFISFFILCITNFLRSQNPLPTIVVRLDRKKNINKEMKITVFTSI